MALKLRILYIAHRINSLDGSSVHGRAFVNSIKKLGHDIITYPAMITIDYSKQTVVPDSEKDFWYYLRKINFNLIKGYLHRSNAYVSEYLSFVEGLWGSILQRRKLMHLLKAFKADVIVFRYHPYNLSPFWTSKATGIPIVLEVNSLRSMENKLRRRRAVVTGLTRWTEKFAIKSADAIFAVSGPILKKITTIDQKKPAIMVENGVDCDHFDPQRFSKHDAKIKLGLKNKIVIGYVGSFMPWHDLDTTIETLCLLRRIDSNYHLVLIGHGVEYKRIRKKVADKQLSQAVTFIDSVPHEQINEHLAAFDVALMTYPQIDSFYFSPLKMFEYLAMGLTVVATNIGQIGEIITQGMNGILVDSPTPENFADAIHSSISNNLKIGSEARKLVKENYSWIKNATEIAKLAEMAIEQKITDGI